MIYLYLLFLVLHIACAAAWFGLSLALSMLARRLGATPTVAPEVLVEQGTKLTGRMDLFALLMYAFGVLVVLVGPGFGGLGWPFHMALMLGLGLILAQRFVIRPAWAGLAKDASAGQIVAGGKRVAMSIGLGHLLWFGLLLLMFASRIPGV